jgi:hypothetical protein
MTFAGSVDMAISPLVGSSPKVSHTVLMSEEEEEEQQQSFYLLP